MPEAYSRSSASSVKWKGVAFGARFRMANGGTQPDNADNDSGDIPGTWVRLALMDFVTFGEEWFVRPQGATFALTIAWNANPSRSRML